MFREKINHLHLCLFVLSFSFFLPGNPLELVDDEVEKPALILFCARVGSSVRPLTSYVQVKDLTETCNKNALNICMLYSNLDR